MKVAKKTAISFVALCLLTAFIISFSSALTCPSQYNLISNSGFESGTGASADFWRIFEPNPGNEGYRTSNFKFSGNFSMQFDMPVSIYPGGWGQAFIHDAVSVQPNTQYVFSGMIYNNLSHGNAYIDLNDTSFECENRSEKQDNWQKTECIITTSNSATVVYPRVVVDGPDLPLNTGNVWFDNISLVKKDQCIDESLLDFYLDDFAGEDILICEENPVIVFHSHTTNNTEARNVSVDLYLNNNLVGLVDKLEFPASGHINQRIDFGHLYPGNYAIKLVVDPENAFNESNENNNFTFNFEVLSQAFCGIPDAAPGSVSNLRADSKGTNFILWRWDNPTDSDFSQNIVFLNGVNVVNTSQNFYNATGLASNTNYVLMVHTKDISGNINNTNVANTAKTNALNNQDDDDDDDERRISRTINNSIQISPAQESIFNESAITLNMPKENSGSRLFVPLLLVLGILIIILIFAIILARFGS